jgi:hypothetical protein
MAILDIRNKEQAIMSTELEKMNENNEPVLTALKDLKWPTSRPGPMAKQPPQGQKPVPTRTEQMIEINYDQELGRHTEPS